MAILQSNMGEEITNGVSDVLKELYGVLELMTVYMLCLGILIGVVLVVIAMVLNEWTWRVGDQQ